MTRRELREEIFKLLFMVEFYSKEEMAEQVKSYFEDFPEKEISEKDHAYIEEKIREHLRGSSGDRRGRLQEQQRAGSWSESANPIFPSCAWVSTRCFTMMISPSA